MPEASIIRCTELRKTYGSQEALRGMTFDVPRGSVFGFLGRNGAGKSTTMKIMLGMVHPTSGAIEVFGVAANDPRASVAIRRRTAFVSEEKDLYDYMSVEQLLRFAAGLFPSWRADLATHYVKSFGIPRQHRIKSLSQGTRTKLALLLGLATGAELLILDEPTTGLDPAAAEAVLHAIIGHVSQEGVTVFLSSHNIAEIDQAADHLAIVNNGQVVVTGAIDDVRESYRRVRLVFDGAVPQHAVRMLGIEGTSCDGRVLEFMVKGDAERALLKARALRPISVDVAPVTLKEIFLESVAPEA